MENLIFNIHLDKEDPYPKYVSTVPSVWWSILTICQQDYVLPAKHILRESCYGQYVIVSWKLDLLSTLTSNKCISNCLL